MKSGTEPSSPLLLDLIIKAFKDIGYELTYKQQEATDFGVPQKRKRILLVGYDTNQVTNFDPIKFWTDVTEEGKKLPRISQADFITNSMEGAAPIPPTSIPEHFATYAQPVPQQATPTGKPHPYVTLKIGENLLSCSKRDSPIHSEIINKQAPSKTIICTYDHQPRLLVGLRKPDGTSYARTLHPDELKQIQGFPEDYKVLGSHKEQVVQIGNAVPPPMIEAVARALQSSLHSPVPAPVPAPAPAPTVIRFRRKRAEKE
jgi:DNA (cytosine-5)-methyltransferase 1